jgi:hypothetical protein
MGPWVNAAFSVTANNSDFCSEVDPIRGTAGR